MGREDALRRAAAVLAIAALYFVPLGWFGLNEPDEGRYAEIAREMLESGDWVTPRLNYVKYFEKPPLVYWATAAAQWLFGPGDGVNRSVPAACGLLTIGLTFVLARDMFGAGVARYAVMLLATAPLFFAMSQVLTLDIPLTASVTAALFCFWFGYTRPARRAWWYRAMYAAVALGVLIKGPIAIVLPGITVALFLLIRWEWGEMRQVLRPDGVALAALITVPWFVLVSVRNPEFPWFFFVHEHWQRYTSTGEHRQPWWFYVPMVMVSMAPWTVLVIGDLRGWWATARRLSSPAQVFCAVWALAMLVFFSASISKLGTYVLPLFPALAILMAAGVRDQIEGQRARGLRLTAWFLIAFGAVCVIAAGVIAYPGLIDPRVRVVIPQLLIAGPALGATGRVVQRLLRRDRLEAAFRVFVGGLMVFLGVAMSGRNVANHYRELAGAVGAAAGPNDLIVSYGQYVQGLPFYTRRRVIAARAWGELDFGRQQGDQSAFFWPDDGQLIEAWKAERRIVMVLSRPDLERLRPLLAPAPIEIARQGKKVAVTNKPAGESR